MGQAEGYKKQPRADPGVRGGRRPSTRVSVKDRAGRYDGEDGERLYLFTSQGLHEALKGFDFSTSLDILVAAGALPPRGREARKGPYR